MWYVLKEYFIALLRILVFTRYMTLKKFLNLMAIFLQHRILRNPKVRGYPVRIYVDPTSVCNLRCPLCPSGSQNGAGIGQKLRSKGYMSFENFKKIIDEIGEYLFEVDLYIWGEPLLNKEITDMVSYAHKSKVRTRIFSNMTILSEDMAEKLIEGGLDELVASIDGASQETYQKYRVGGNFEKVYDNLKLMVDVKKKLGSKNPTIQWQFLVMKHNEHEVKKAREMAKELGIYFRILPIRVGLGEESDDEMSRVSKYIDWLPTIGKYSRYNGVERKFKIKNCLFLWTQSFIQWNGSISPCCASYDEKHDFGNMFTDGGFMNVWNGKTYMDARRMVKSKNSFNPRIICSVCLKRGFFIEP